MVTSAELKVQGVKSFRHVDNPKRLLKDSPDFLYLQMIFTNMVKPDFVRDGLTMLEDALGAELLKRFKAGASDAERQRTDQVNKQATTTGFQNYYQTQPGAFVDRPRGDVNIYKGLLTSVLGASEDRFGFGSLSYAWGTSSDAFLTNLKARRPFKDYGASKDHGDNTHRVQWYIICNALFNGIADASKFYEATAYWVCDQSDRPDHGNVTYLWELLCDNAANTTGWSKAEAAGLNPIYVMDQMRNGAFPLLAAFCTYRRAKDLSSESKSPHFSTDEGEKLKAAGVMPKTLHRASLRYFGQPLTSLSTFDRQRLVRVLGELGFTNQ